jgi:hypothetical protein
MVELDPDIEMQVVTGRSTWRIQDAAGRCLAHCDHIVGPYIDQRIEIALAKATIRDGRMSGRRQKPNASCENVKRSAKAARART